MATFVLEIGTEELPSRFLAGEQEHLKGRFLRLFEEQGIEHGRLEVLATPRRAALVVEDMNPVQLQKEEEISGPPVRVAYKDGAPSKALEGFCRTNGVQLSDIYTLKTPKGEYVAVKKMSGGRRSAEIVAEAAPEIISQTPFGKRMHWGPYSFLYSRPIQWILALMDSEVVPFEVGPVQSGRSTRGHRIHGFGPFEVPSAGDYLKVLEEQGKVVLDPARRRQIIIEGADAQAKAVGGRVLWNDALLDEVCGLVEHPVPLIGNFDEAYLEVPREVLVTSMQTHQKSFGVEDARGNLLPHFVTVLNIEPEDIELVRHGWERVLRARLEDARFFWKEDLKCSFGQWLEKLDHVIFIRGLGSMGDKTRRLEKLCSWIDGHCGLGLGDKAARAGRLSKADLVSGMVGEFDTLQGVMGGIYAAKMGEDGDAAAGVAEQYLPAGPDSPLPRTVAGAVLSVADKADTLAGCFGLGMIPTGAADPNGLRRCALGMVRILRSFGFKLDVRALFSFAVETYGGIAWKNEPKESVGKLMDFFAGRLRNYYQSLGKDTLLVDAALGADLSYVKGVDGRLEALEAFSKGGDYAKSVQTFKRVANIVKKQSAAVEIPEEWQASLLREEPEKKLGETLSSLLPKLDALWASESYGESLGMLGELRPFVDAFFDGVMVACEDEALRKNRLAMLKSMAGRFSKLADFSALQI